MTWTSCLYAGSVMHRRLRPRWHRFRYRVFWLFLDLDEIDRMSARLWWFSHNRFNLFSFRDGDHGDGSPTQLRAQIERKTHEAGIDCSGAVIRLLCMPRMLGYCFNPLSIFFCYDRDGALAALVYEVHNTFGERHSYVIPVAGNRNPVHQQCAKRFYVSPFMDMDLRYDFRVTGPAERIGVGVTVSDAAGPVLQAVLEGRRRRLDDANLLALFVANPLASMKVIAAIHWEAARLWLKRISLRRRPPPPARDTTTIFAKPSLPE